MNIKTNAYKINKLVRTITVAPVMALILLLTLYFAAPQTFGKTDQLIFAIIFLTILPILAYPLQPFIPAFKAKGRDGQRRLAIITAVIGYVCGIFYSAFSSLSKSMLIVYLTYFISGTAIALFNKFKIKASGHACGIAGPITLLVYFTGPCGLLGLPIYFTTFICSILMKRHTAVEFLLGSLISIIAAIISVNICINFISF